jgi:hypothetical protein
LHWQAVSHLQIHRHTDDVQAQPLLDELETARVPYINFQRLRVAMTQ